MISVEDWAEIRRLHRAEGLPIRQVARVMDISRNTVRAALRSDGPPRYERAAKGSVADGFEPRIRELLRLFPAMPSTVIAERIGWPYSIRTLSGRVADLRPAYLPPDPASRTAYAAGELAQCDFWFPDVQVPAGFGQVRTARQLPVLTMVCGYSRWASALLVPSRCAEDLFAGWWAEIEALGAASSRSGRSPASGRPRSSAPARCAAGAGPSRRPAGRHMLPSSWASCSLVETDASQLPASARSGGPLLHRITRRRP